MPLVATVLVVLTMLAGAVAVGAPQATEPLPDIDTSTSANGVVALPQTVSPVIREVFAKYTKVVAPNGKPIHILAQDGWSDARIVKARNVLEHILRDVPGTKYGADKRIVANAMADNRATLTLFRTEPDMRAAFRGPLRDVELGMQDLRANEAPVEGHEDYMAHRTRDASYEEVLHMVHDYGIKPALPEMQEELRRITRAAMDRGLWRGNQDDLENEPNEYFAAIYDNYLDLWTVPPTVYEGRPIDPDRIPAGTSHFGGYGARGRHGLRLSDPEGLAILQEFFPPFLTYTPELPAEFEGTFSMQRDGSLRYTAKSQHLKNATLTGNNDAGLIGNAWDNQLTGNSGDNTLRGNAGADLLDGGHGTDTAVYEGNADEYDVARDGATIRVTDRRIDRDGSDLLLNIERLAFADGTVSLQDLASAAGPASYADLLGLFEDFRAFLAAQRVEGVPDYSASAMADQFEELKQYQQRLAAMDPGDWSISQQVDYQLVRAEMNGLEFRHRVLVPWLLDPGFYNDALPRTRLRGDGALTEEQRATLRDRLRSVGGILEQARVDLDDLSAVAGDLGTLAVLSLGDTRAAYESLRARLAEHHPELVADLEAALAAIDGYIGWIEANKHRMTARAGVGKDNYNWLLKNVYLFPYTWEEVRTIVELEDNRVITYQRLEENRNRDVPAIEPVQSQAEYKASVSAAIDHLMDFLRDQEIFTVNDYLTPDEYFGSWHGFDNPWPEKHDYFFNFSHREPLMEETHEMVGHHFDGLRSRNDDRPIRGGRRPFKIGTARGEGFAFALEELLMHAGYLDGRNPHGREIAYEQSAFRTVRALSDIYMHSGDWTLADAMEFCVANAPHGELLDGSHHLWFELDTTLRGVGHHMLMVVGKVQFIKLFRDRANQLGDEFKLSEFLDEVLDTGSIPWSLIRWEMTGLDDEIRQLTSG